MCSCSFTAKSRNNPKSQLNTPGPRRLLRLLLPREPARQDPGLLGSYVSPKANGSYQKPDVLPVFFGFPNDLLIGGELPGQAAPQSPQTVNGVPPKALIKLLICHPDTTGARSEEHTSELQSLAYLVCRLLLEKKKHTMNPSRVSSQHYREHG